MCGFAGFWVGGGVRHDDAIMTLRRMGEAIAHRGPDDAGEFVDAEAGVGFAFRRLAIIDLTPLGHQPMRSEHGRFTIVFNGEIYNHQVLRAALLAEGVQFRGRSDTETLCAGFERWGIEATLERAAGMFAIAAWDHQTHRLVLARDRIGIKPLYVYADGQRVAFASELKSLALLPGVQLSLDREAVTEYTGLLYVPGPRTIWQRVTKLTPGALLEITDPRAPRPRDQRYWAIEEVAMRGRLGGRTVSEADAPDLVAATVGAAVREHLESDVPLGAFLSAGIDSSTVVSLMQQARSTPVRTFTVQFDDPVHDESLDAAAIARHLGTQHTTLPMSGDRALDWIPRLAQIYDEPFADASQLPSLLVSAAARDHVTVVLTGDGGDELFAGYNRYRFGTQIIPRLRRVPSPVRHALASLVDAVPAGAIDGGVAALARVAAPLRSLRLAEEKARKLGRLLATDGDGARYHRLSGTTGLGRDAALPRALAIAFSNVAPDAALLDRMLLADQLGYLPDNQMTKVDRASMAVSLEARVPLLDHRVIEMAWQLPATWLLRHGVTKYALRQLVGRYVPPALLDRPKTGFSVPLGPWIRGPLRDWAADLLATPTVAHGPLNATRVDTAFRRLLGGRDDVALECWSYLQFESWRRTWCP